MNIKSLSTGLSFLKKVQGQRQTYYVFEGKNDYFVFSFSKSKTKSGYFNMVPGEAIAYVKRLTAGKQGVTAQSLFKRSRTRKFVGSPLEALNILYVLVAIDRAKIDRRHKSRQLFFNINV